MNDRKKADHTQVDNSHMLKYWM